jgi:hypothetical protein
MDIGGGLLENSLEHFSSHDADDLSSVFFVLFSFEMVGRAGRDSELKCRYKV